MFPYTSSRVFLCYIRYLFWHTVQGWLGSRALWVQSSSEWQSMGMGWGGGGVPAVSQVTDLSSVPIDRAQHRRAPEISQQRDKRQKSHTVRWCANCLWLLTSPTPAGWISVVQSSPPASGPVCGVWTRKSLGAMGQVTVYLLGHIRWHTYILYIRCNDCSICKHTIMNLLYYWVT